MIQAVKFESYEQLHGFLQEPFKSDLQAMVDRNAAITISPLARPGSEPGGASWLVTFYSGKRKFGRYGGGANWSVALAMCDALADVIPNAKVVID